MILVPNFGLFGGMIAIFIVSILLLKSRSFVLKIIGSLLFIPFLLILGVVLNAILPDSPIKFSVETFTIIIITLPFLTLTLLDLFKKFKK